MMHARQRRRLRRATMYIAVLMISTIVAVIGVSALMFGRIQFRLAEEGGDVISARLGAQSAIELGYFMIANDPAWRSTFTHDQWTVEQTLGEGTIAWKLVDQNYTDLLTDPNSPVRLYGRGQVDDAVRLFSVLLESATDAANPNLLNNPGFESGASGWDDSFCDISATTDEQHGGAASLLIEDRWFQFGGPTQDLLGTIENGVTYDAGVWMKMDSGSASAALVIRTRNTSYQSSYAYGEYVAVNDAEWTLLTAELTPTWSGTLNQAHIKVLTASGTEDFYIDDAALREQNSVEVSLSPGSWRREVLP